MQKQITIITSLYQPKHFEDFFADTVRQTVFDLCQWEIFEVGVDKPSLDVENLPENVNYSFSKKRLTIYEVWNILIKAAETPLIANYNCDDRSHPQHLEKLLFSAHIYSSYDLFYCPNLETLGENETFENNSANGRCFPCLAFDPNTYWKNNSAHARPLWRKSLHEKYGYFDEQYKICADYEMWLRAISKGSRFFKICNEPLYLYHRNEAGVSTSEEGIKNAISEIQNIRQNANSTHV